MTTMMQNKKSLTSRYFCEAARLYLQNGKVDDFDITNSTGDNFEQIANLKLPILSTMHHLNNKFNFSGAMTDGDTIVLLDESTLELHRFNFILTPVLSFSANVGINEIEYDGGISRHIGYLSLFFPDESIKLSHFSNEVRYPFDEDQANELYTKIYTHLGNSLSFNPMALYSLLTGIKKHYGLLDDAVLLETDGFTVVNFRKLKDPSFINKFSEIEIESSDISPRLNFSFEGVKLLHLRTKVEKKNSTFKLRFFIETSSRFLHLFADC